MSPALRQKFYGKNYVRFSAPVFASGTLPPVPPTASRAEIPAPKVPAAVANPFGNRENASTQPDPVPEDTLAPAKDDPSGNVFMTLWAQYNELLEEHPIMVKSMTSFFGFMIGDICAQSIFGEGYDPMRTARLTLFGVVMDGPVGKRGKDRVLV